MPLSPSSTFLELCTARPAGQRTLTPPNELSPEVARGLGLTAFLGLGHHGTLASLARTHHCSREHVVRCRDAFEAHHQQLFAMTEPSKPPARSVNVDRQHVERALILSRAECPVSIRSLCRLTHNFLDISIGYGTVWNIVSQAERAAATKMRDFNLKQVRTIALDELFCQGAWVLVVVDVHTHVVCGLKVVASRSEAAWSELLIHLRDKQNLNPSVIVSDAGSGLLAAADTVFPNAQRSHDIFHVKQALLELLGSLERRAYKALGAYYDALTTRKNATKSQRRKLGQQLRRAEEESDRCIATHDKCYFLVLKAFKALEFIDVDTGELRRGEDCAKQLEEVGIALRCMKDRRAKKVGTYVFNMRQAVTSYIDRITSELMCKANTLDEKAVVLTAACVHRLDREGATRFHASRRGANQKLRERLLDGLLELDIQPQRLLELFVGTCRAITQSGRASSIVECFNSIIRKFLQIHKRMSEGALTLVAARWTLARRKTGPLAGTSPFTELTGREVQDWLVELGLFPTAPSKPPFGELPQHEQAPCEDEQSQDWFESFALAA